MKTMYKMGQPMLSMSVRRREYIQPSPPWYWRLVGRVYWKGWQLQMWFIDYNEVQDSDPGPVEFRSLHLTTEPSKIPPNPVAVSEATEKLILDAADHFQHMRAQNKPWLQDDSF